MLEEDDIAAGGVEGIAKHVLIFTHAGSLPRLFHVPRPAAIQDLRWRVFIHTGQSPPDDVFPDGMGPVVDVTKPLELPERSLVCLVADAEPVIRKRIAGAASQAV